jgi:hypothetical protein
MRNPRTEEQKDNNGGETQQHVSADGSVASLATHAHFFCHRNFLMPLFFPLPSKADLTILTAWRAWNTGAFRVPE